MKQANLIGQLVPFDDLPDSAFVRLNQLLSTGLVPFSAATTWRRVRAGTFPKPVRISPQVTAWRVGQIREWSKCPGNFVADCTKSHRSTCKGSAS
jgi:prophage regulatory protein